MNRRELDGWIPFRIQVGAEARTVDWCHLGEERFTDPFFEQTIGHCLRTPFNQLFLQHTGIDALLERHAGRTAVAPTAFIFHSSRCGSTLFSQMAAALPGAIVISEAPPIDQILRASATEAERIAWLQALLGELGQPRAGDERHLFVKLDAWHAIDIGLVQRAFPAVPCVFLYREPAAIIASQERMPGIHMIPGMLDPAVVGLGAADVLRLDRAEYCARLLAALYEAAAPFAARGAVDLVNYSELPGAAVVRLVEWCNLGNDVEAQQTLREAARFDAKTPSLLFDPTDAAGRSPSHRAREMAARFVARAYADLEALRLASANRIEFPSAR